MTNTIKNTTIDSLNEAETINSFLQFCYCFPYDLKDRMVDKFGQSLGNHFYGKFEHYTDKSENNFIGLIKTVANMSTRNKALFIQIVNEYNEEIN